jgi:hypothetical protein
MNIDDQALIAAMQRAGIRPHSTSYRGQFGRPSCMGVRCQRLASLVIDLVQACDTIDQAYVVAGLLDRADEDALGMGRVVYWPWIEWTPEIAAIAASIEVRDDDDDEDEDEDEDDEMEAQP